MKSVYINGFKISRTKPSSKEAAQKWGEEWYEFEGMNHHGSACKQMLKFYVGEATAKEAIAKLTESKPNGIKKP